MSWRSDFARLNGAVSDIEDHCVSMDDKIGELEDLLDQKNAEIESLKGQLKDADAIIAEMEKHS